MPNEMSTEQIIERKKNITILVTTYYNNNSQILRKKHLELDDLIENALKKYLYTDLSMADIEQDIINIIYKIKNELDNDFGEGIKTNEDKKEGSANSMDNQLDNSIDNQPDNKLNELVNDLNEHGIDYSIVGLSAATIYKNGEVPTDKMSIIINEKDMGKFSEICKSHGYNLIDKRNNPNRKMENGNIIGDPCASAISENGEEVIDVKDFERLDDNSIITKDYYTNSDGVQCIKADFYANDLANEIFNSDKVNINGTSYPIAAPEFTFISSLNGSNPEDKDIVSLLEDNVDTDRIKEIQNLAVDKFASQITIKEPVEEKKNDELSSMMESEESTNNIDANVNTDSQQKDKPKQFVKTAPVTTSESNGGYVSKLAFVFFLLLIVVLFLTGFVLLNM